jgi:hypothetical protein
MGQQVQIHLIFFEKTRKIFKSKVEDSWTPSKQILKPLNFKQYLDHYFPHVKPLKWQEEKLKTSNFQNMNTKDLQSS